MPLKWNIEGTEMMEIRNTNPEDKRNCVNGFLNAVGMQVLIETLGEYTYSEEWQVLTNELMKKIRDAWLRDIPNVAPIMQEGSMTWQCRTWMPLLVGAKFRREHKF
jgi:hypothetical protein